jgi:hypothetical protein
MRCVVMVMVSLGVLVACGSDMHVTPAAVGWMEWPAEVARATPFPVRLSGGDNLPCVRREFVVAPSIDSSLITFEPYFLHREGARPCNTLAAQQFDLLLPVYWDTTVSAPGLSAGTYEMRAKTYNNVRVFGEVVVGADSTGRLNAGGGATVARDTNGCLRVKPAGVSTGYVLENPPDTVSPWSAFVQGYLYDATTPVCGEVRVFHLIARD